MARLSSAAGLKGQTGPAVAVIAVILIVVVVILAGPSIGLNIGGIFGGGAAAPIGVGPGSAGVVITSFTANPPQTDSGQTVDFDLIAQNNGGINAKNIQYTIFGLSDSNSWGGASVTQTGQDTLGFADTSRSIPGETTTQEWESTSVAKNADITYPVTARVDYGYSTESDLLLTLYGRNNANVKNTGITQSSLSQVSTTVGPMTVTPMGSIPLVGTSASSFRVTFNIANTGGGRNYYGDKSSGLDEVSISATGCTISGQTTVKLINGQKTVSCQVTPSIDSTGQETKTITLKLDYNYIVEKSASVRVLKQPEQP